MPHIHTELGQHDLVVSAFIIRTDGPEPRAVLHLHKKLNRWMQFGGHVELNETPWQAIAHELREETGYELDQLKLLQPKLRIEQVDGAQLHPIPVCINTHPIPDNHFHTDLEYAFVTDQPPRFAPDDGESTHIKLMSSADIRGMHAEQATSNSNVVFLQIIEKFLHEWEAVDPRTFQL